MAWGIKGMAALLATIAAPAAIARDPGPALSAPNPAAPATAAPADTAADQNEAALALKPMDPRMGVDVMIDGDGPYRFLVDSGANRTVVSSALAARLKLPPAGTVDLNSVIGETKVASVDIDTLSLGGVDVHAIQAPVLDAANIGGPAILGIDALDGKRVTIDLRAHRMTISRSTHYVAPAADGEIVVTARRRNGQLILADADIGGEHIDAVIDSGSEATIGNLALEQRLTARGRATAVPVTLLDVAGNSTTASLAELPDLRVGELHLQHVPVAFTDAHAFHQFGLVKKPAMLLGMDVLNVFRRVSLDFASRSVRFLAADPNHAELASAARKPPARN